MIPKINTFTLYLCCGTCYHNSIRFSSYFEALFALYGSSIPSSVLNPEFLMVISNVPVADPGGGVLVVREAWTPLSDLMLV